MAIFVLLVVALALTVVGVLTNVGLRSRTDRFALAYMVDIVPEYLDANRAYAMAYLVQTRRWRAAGVVCAVCASVLVTSRTGTITVDVATMVGGWFLGALIAEARFHTPIQRAGWSIATEREKSEAEGVPQWMHRVSLIGGIISIAATTLIVAAGHPGPTTSRVVTLGIAALGICVVIAIAVRAILVRPGPGFMADVDAAVRARSIGAVVAGGTFLVAVCAVEQLAAVRTVEFGVTASAMRVAAAIVGIGAVAMAFILTVAARRGYRDQRDPRTMWAGPRMIVAVVAVVMVAPLATIGYGQWKDHAPYASSAIHPMASIRLTDEAHFLADERALGIYGFETLVDTPGSRSFIGRIDLAAPTKRTVGRYYVIVIDKSTNTVVPHLWDHSGGGWDGFLDSVPKQVPWLSGMLPIVTPAGYTDVGSDVSASAMASGPIEFYGDAAEADATEADLAVALIFVGPNDQIYWATRVPLTT